MRETDERRATRARAAVRAPAVELSIVVPAYREARRLGPSLEAIAAWIAAGSRVVEVIVVDDGSPDATAAAARSRAGLFKKLYVVAHDENRGKGAALRTGVARARGRWVLLTDADLSTPMRHADDLVLALERGADVAVGSRRVAGSVIERRQRPHRRAAGTLFRWLVRLLVPVGVEDSQCGFKAFRRDAAQAIAARAVIDRFAFDVEWLALARRLEMKVVERPVSWKDDRRSTVRLGEASWRMLADLWRLRARLKTPWLADRSLE